jgi:nitroreductase
MNITLAIHGRRAIRAYDPRPLAKAQIEAVIAAAIQAPSAMNAQDWVFHVITDPAVLTQASHAVKRHVAKTTPIGVVSHHFDAILNDDGFHIFYHAPALVWIDVEACP